MRILKDVSNEEQSNLFLSGERYREATKVTENEKSKKQAGAELCQAISNLVYADFLQFSTVLFSLL